MNNSPKAAAALVAVNLFALAGPLAFGWNLSSLLFLYWLELVIVGLYNIEKMRRAEGLGELGKSRSYQAIFFIAHYATFCVLYGVALRRVIAGPDAALEGSRIALAIAAVALVASHAASFKLNFLERGEFSKTTSLGQMFVPYERAVPVHVAVVIAAVVARGFEGSVLSLTMLAAVKLGADLLMHVLHHNALANDLSSPPREAS